MTFDRFPLLNPSLKFDTIKVKAQRERNKENNPYWRQRKKGKRWEILYQTIPSDDLLRYKLPDYKNIKSELQRKRNSFTSDEEINTQKFWQVVTLLQNYIEANYLKYISQYSIEYNKDIQKSEKFAKEHALRAGVICYKEADDITKSELHRAYLHLSQANRPVKAFSKFSTCINHTWNTESGISLIHGHKGKAKAYLQKVTEKHKAIIEKAVIENPQIASFKTLYRLVIKPAFCTEQINDVSIATCRNYYNENYVRLLKFIQPGRYKNEILPTTHRHRAEYACNRWEMDGTLVQIQCVLPDGSIIRLNVFIVIDTYSGKILGWNFSETEDFVSVYKAMKMAVEMSGYLPNQWCYDNGSWSKKQEFANFINEVKLLGCELKPAPPGRPTYKARVERLFETVQTQYQATSPHYMGEGITSKRENAHTDKEVMQRTIYKVGFNTKSECINMLNTMILAYNQETTDTRIAPSELFSKSEKPYAVAVTPEKRAMLFWTNTILKVSVSQIKLTIRKQAYWYEIKDYQLREQLNGKQIRVYYDSADLSTIQIFELNGTYIGELSQTILIHEAKADATEKDRYTAYGHKQRNKGFDSYLDAKTKNIQEAGELVNPLPKPYNTLEKMIVNSEETKAYNEYYKRDNDIDFANNRPVQFIEPEILNTKQKLQKRQNAKYNKPFVPETVEINSDKL